MSNTRPNLNFIEGDQISIAISDNGGLDATDVEITAIIPGGGAGTSGNPFPLIVNNFYDPSINANTQSAQSVIADNFRVVPFFANRTFTLDQFGASCATGPSPGINLKYAVYSTGADGWPSVLLQSTGDIATGTGSGYKPATSLSWQLEEGTFYWLAVRSSGAASLTAHPAAQSISLGLGNNGGVSTPTRHIFQTLTYASAFPDPFGSVVNADLTTDLAPSLRFRVASVP